MGFFTNLSICLLGITLSNPFLGAKANTCPRDWLQNQGNCYGYFSEKLSWAEAENECQSYGRGTHLASILTNAEALLVARYISNNQKNPCNVWIGLHDPRQNSRWRWSDGSVYSHKAWNLGQPNNFRRSQHCVELMASTGLKEWNDIGCQNVNPYICKHEL